MQCDGVSTGHSGFGPNFDRFSSQHKVNFFSECLGNVSDAREGVGWSWEGAGWSGVGVKWSWEVSEGRRNMSNCLGKVSDGLGK